MRSLSYLYGSFYSVLFVRLKMSIGQAIHAYRILERVFHSDAWKNQNQQACFEILNIALDEIVNVLEIGMSLDSPFAEKNPQTKCFVCVVNPAAKTRCRLLRNYRSRIDQGPLCTIRQVLQATLSNHVQLPAVYIEEEFFLSALKGYANPTHTLVKELGNAYPRSAQVACLANIGADDLSIQGLTNQENAEELVGILRSCQLVADDVTSHCHSLGSFFFRLSAPSQFGQQSYSLEDDISQVKGMTMAYLSVDEISTRLDDLEERLRERFGVVTIERLNSVAGKDGESRVAARLAKVEEHLNDTIFQDMKNWLQPIHQTSKLDANIRARSGTTCKWLLENDTFLQWMEKRGLFWFRGLMGTGKTVMSSFVTETVLTRDDVYAAYYYFEFTNPSTLSEEAFLRSLVCQLAGISPFVVREFHRKHNNGGLQPQLSTLQNTLNELVATSTKPVFIIIDALDELPFAQRKYFLRSLVTFSRSNRASRTHIMVTSREEVDMARAFKGVVDFELAVQGDLVRQDIAAFVDQELAAQKWTHWPREAVEMARRLLNERADGQFRMVACQVDILQQVKTFEQLQRSLNSLPKTLGETYNYILDKIPEDLRDQAHRLFAILSFASEPISARELSALLAVELGDEDSDQLPVLQEKNRMADPLDVVDLGTSLVSRRNSFRRTSLVLAHASVKEHLLLPSNTWFSLCEDLAHSMIARSCLTLLVHFQILQQKAEYPWPRPILMSNAGALHRYSTSNWFKHVRPNGSPQLLRQQQQIYGSFPWPCINWRNKPPYNRAGSALVSAASLGLFDLVEALLSTRSWNTKVLTVALTAAASSEGVELVSIQCCGILLTYGADVNAFTVRRRFLSSLDRDYLSPLEYADVNASGGKYVSALHAAVYCGSLEIVRFLVENGADVNASRGEYGSALHAGVHCGNLEIVRFLVENGADVNASGRECDPALQYAASRGSLKIVRFFIENGADVNASGGEYDSALQAGACHGRLEIVRFLIEKGADMNAIGGRYGSALHAGACCGKLEVVRFLVEKGANVNTVGGAYGSVLQGSAYHGRLKVVRFLVESGADLNAIGGYHKTAVNAARDSSLLSSRKTDRDEVVEYLKSRGAKTWEEMSQEDASERCK
ncbi:hypothetical protein DL96DRAFT_1006693 [Flagelloscypha sp. PMI_526]|nr:hypothetical protein DL96DRAFT_1006693 [Flagelloscypha sp. PMI_526]